MAEDPVIYTGLVKWFGNKQTGDDYGFIYNPEFGDIFVHKRSLKEIIIKNDLVEFELKHSENKGEKYEALNVIKIRPNKICDMCVDWLLTCDQYESNRIIHYKLYSITDASEYLLSSPYLEKLEGYIESNIKEMLTQKKFESASIRKCSQKINELFSKDLSYSNYSKNPVNINFVNFFAKSKNDYVRFLGWYKKIIDGYDPKLITEIYRLSDQYLREHIIELVQYQDLSELVSISISSYEELPPVNNHSYSQYYQFLSPMIHEIKSIIKILDVKDKNLSKIFLQGIYPKCSRDLKFKLWLDWDLLDCNNEVFELIIEQFSKFESGDIHIILNRFIDFPTKTRNDFVNNYLIPSVNSIFSENLKLLFNRWKNDTCKDYANRLIENLDIKYKTEVWLDGILDKLDLNEIKEGFAKLSSYYQIKSLKKILYYYNESTKNRINDFIENTLNQLKLKSTDFEVLLVLNLLSIKIKGEKIRLREFITQALQLIKSDSQFQFYLSSSSELFETCKGRGILSVNNNEPTIFKTSDIPEGIIYCEGRKAVNQESNIPIKNNGKQFFWCKNKPCFSNEIHIKKSGNIFGKSPDEKPWDEDQLFDIMKRIDKEYTVDEHSFSLGVFNKFFNYLKHLKCRSCKSWLSPVVQSNYGYDRVNKFKCEQENCDQNGKEIYISHCLNFRCSNIVDSRDSKQCSHGWYICDYCFACCATEKLKGRKEIRLITDQVYSGPEQGHDDTEDIFCHRCGNLLSVQVRKINSDRINEIFHSFQQLTGIEPVRQGKKQNGNRWILIKPHSLSSVRSLYSKVNIFETDGVIINENDSGNGLFISEPLSDKIHILTCSNKNCNFSLYLENIFLNEKEKANALRYHKKIDLLFKN